MQTLAFFLLTLQTMAIHHHMQGMAGGTPQIADELSLFNHHFAGWLLVLTGSFACLEESPLQQERRWVRYLWPAPLIFRLPSELSCSRCSLSTKVGGVALLMPKEPCMARS